MNALLNELNETLTLVHTGERFPELKGITIQVQKSKLTPSFWVKEGIVLEGGKELDIDKSYNENDTFVLEGGEEVSIEDVGGVEYFKFNHDGRQLYFMPKGYFGFSDFE